MLASSGGGCQGGARVAADSRPAARASLIEPGERKEVHLIQSSPPDGGRAVVQNRPYALPGDKFSAFELNLFDVANWKQTKVRVDFGMPRVHWNRDGYRFMYDRPCTN